MRDTWLTDTGYLPTDLASILIRAQAAPGGGSATTPQNPAILMSQI
ncbi:hypothetical protein XACS584_370001 [Xanthomonas citri pv. citri]|nr:hypothetical protein XAC1083_280039 [Xanthomonas citri pv. citri]CEE36210.1 hypothetical protein XAC902_350036 [Xanthomonas citri pv. citri]CEE50907.1 hypothetical protein XAC71A_1290007 [Xanthomonas citri pv. citri]CEE65332.1 hypothetical protein XACS584_370001 [Xanthomonas citri pv. citri]CEE73379.1 hypothetical protein XAC3608_650001 [Xanthomonas citri pv. citri]